MKVSSGLVPPVTPTAPLGKKAVCGIDREHMFNNSATVEKLPNLFICEVKNQTPHIFIFKRNLLTIDSELETI
jgi:hypothetical protein